MPVQHLRDGVHLRREAESAEATLNAEERAEAIKVARETLDRCRKLFSGAGLGGPGALEADCEFAIRALDRVAAALHEAEGGALRQRTTLREEPSQWPR